MGVNEGMLLMQVMTVASVTEKKVFPKKINESNSTNPVRSLRHHSPHYTPFQSLSYTPYQQ